MESFGFINSFELVSLGKLFLKKVAKTKKELTNTDLEERQQNKSEYPTIY